MCRNLQASLAKSGYSYMEVVKEGRPSSGTEMVICRCLVARRVCVHREAVQERICSRRRSVALERKLKMSAGVRLA